MWMAWQVRHSFSSSIAVRLLVQGRRADEPCVERRRPSIARCVSDLVDEQHLHPTRVAVRTVNRRLRLLARSCQRPSETFTDEVGLVTGAPDFFERPMPAPRPL